MNINELESKNIEPSVEELDLERIAWKVSRDPYRLQMSENDISRAVHQYRRFLSLKIRYPKVRLVPTEDIDLIWHTHILDTANYLSDCERLFGASFTTTRISGSWGARRTKKWKRNSGGPQTSG